MMCHSWFRGLIAAGCLAATLACTQVGWGQRIPIFFEDFEELDLGPVVNEPVPDTFPQAFTKTGPAGWTHQFSQTPPGSAPGAIEWSGWSFVNPEFWNAAGGNDRSAFDFGTGNVIAVADGNLFQSALGDQGSLNALLRTPPISLQGVGANQAFVEFDSSWRFSGSQKAILNAIYDGGTPVKLFEWDSNPFSFNFKPDANPGYEFLSLNNPATAQQVVLEFAYQDAGDDWWWAVDNINVSAGGESLFSEDFEGLTLGPPVDAPVFSGEVDQLWTRSGPSGWFVNNSTIPGINSGDDLDGVDEWAGWTFADKSWWIANGMNQGRSEFKLGSGTVAVADPGQWSDQPNLAGQEGWYRTTLVTPPIPLENLKPETVELQFSNSWRPAEDDSFRQSARIMVSFDGGPAVELAEWISQDVEGQMTQVTAGGEPVLFDEFDLINTTEQLLIPNPAGASEMVLSFEMFDAGNDWWWAIDNLLVTGEELVTLIFGDFDRDGDVDSNDLLFFLGNWTGDGVDAGLTFEDGDSDGDGDVDSNDLLFFLGSWTGSLNSELAPSPLLAAIGEDLAGQLQASAATATVAQMVVVPEPVSSGLALLGLVPLIGYVRRRV